LDEVWYLDVAPGIRANRLVARRRWFGEPLPQAQSWVRDIDEANASIVESSCHRADRAIRLAQPHGRANHHQP
jgi:hypothetical protein